MKTQHKLALCAMMLFISSHFLPAYGSDLGFQCFLQCWQILWEPAGKSDAGAWLYYSGFVLCNVLFPALFLDLLISAKARFIQGFVSLIIFLHVLSWLLLGLFERNISVLNVGYYLWLISYALLLGAYGAGSRAKCASNVAVSL